MFRYQHGGWGCALGLRTWEGAGNAVTHLVQGRAVGVVVQCALLHGAICKPAQEGTGATSIGEEARKTHQWFHLATDTLPHMMHTLAHNANEVHDHSHRHTHNTDTRIHRHGQHSRTLPCRRPLRHCPWYTTGDGGAAQNTPSPCRLPPSTSPSYLLPSGQAKAPVPRIWAGGGWGVGEGGGGRKRAQFSSKLTHTSISSAASAVQQHPCAHRDTRA